MSTITLVKQHTGEIPDADKDAARRVLFGIVDGLGDRGRKQWRRFVNGLMRLEPGEMVDINTHKARSGPFHRRHMAIEQAIYESQERFDNFENGFRDWLKVGAGHCEWFPGPKGGIFPVPKSTSFADMEDDEMREFHEAAIEFLRTEHAQKTLWKHLSVAQRSEMLETILNGFGE